MDEKRVNEMSPLTWAYIGDAVFEIYIREGLVESTKLKPHKLHLESIKHVKASAQAETLKQIEEELTDEEKEIVRRTRNTKNHHLPKNANVNDYMYATAFEGLIGYLYLSRKNRKAKRNIRPFCSRIALICS
ncbi:MAG: Mini-ribonuclease 3 [Clostridia bacterium]|nr:Mini-ribonuclease 3 [Clostridia bacterium]MCI9274763.1 Mini-ribonuclease 3 [Clostridia bacterium]